MVFPTSDGKSELVSATRELHLQVAKLESALSALINLPNPLTRVN
jgi:hypothetical protein